MSKNDEYLFLTEEEARLTSLLAEGEKRIRDLNRKMYDYHQELNVALEFVEALKQNIRMLKYGAPVVGLQRYKEAKHALKANEEVVLDCQYDIERATERVAEIRDASKTVKSELEAIKKRKERFGQIVQFPSPDKRGGQKAGP